MKNFERYYKAIYFLEGLSNLSLKGDYMIKQRHLGVYLKRMRYFLDLIGNPDKGIKFIHITGTAGKGTVTNMVHEILKVSGKNVGSFTSPFVTTSIEKIKVGDKYISPDELADIVEYLKPFIDRAYLEGPYGRPSYFEIFLAIAMVYFKRHKCELVVLEVGLGGRYDATNVIEKPIVTAVTNIDYDHTQILGNTLKEIAYDKAGIIKKGSVFFTSEQRPHLLNVFNKICNEKKVKFNRLYLIIGIAESKDSNLILKQIIPYADKVYISRFQIKDRKCTHPKELINKSRKFLKSTANIEMFLDPEQALSKVLKEAKKDDLVLVVGSFFLAGEVRKKWFPEEFILEKRKSFL